MAQDDSIARLARQIDSARKAERLFQDPAGLAALRPRAASELHRICADFVAAVNGRLAEPLLELSPPADSPPVFHAGVNLVQIGSHGREIQLSFQPTAQPFSTEKFLVPYILEGEIRAFNQPMLERFEVRSCSIFYCIENETAAWRFYDWRTLHTGPLSPEFLAGFMQPLF